MAATDRLDVTLLAWPDWFAVQIEGYGGLPFYLSAGQRLADDFLLGVSPHTLHNLACATRAQTCDLALARDAVDLYSEEMMEALAEKDWQGARRAAMRRGVFEARERELLSCPTVHDAHVKNNMLVPRRRCCDSFRLRGETECFNLGTHIAFMPGHFGASWFCGPHAARYRQLYGRQVWRYEE